MSRSSSSSATSASKKSHAPRGCTPMRSASSSQLSVSPPSSVKRPSSTALNRALDFQNANPMSSMRSGDGPAVLPALLVPIARSLIDFHLSLSVDADLGVVGNLLPAIRFRLDVRAELLRCAGDRFEPSRCEARLDTSLRHDLGDPVMQQLDNRLGRTGQRHDPGPETNLVSRN